MNKEVTFKDLLLTCLLLIVVVAAVMFIGKNQHHPTPINTVNIDSLIENTDSLKVIIQIKDSIKHEEIEKVLRLDNDSTVELFKQLVSE